jgi:hypothetical protein
MRRTNQGATARTDHRLPKTIRAGRKRVGHIALGGPAGCVGPTRLRSKSTRVLVDREWRNSIQPELRLNGGSLEHPRNQVPSRNGYLIRVVSCEYNSQVPSHWWGCLHHDVPSKCGHLRSVRRPALPRRSVAPPELPCCLLFALHRGGWSAPYLALQRFVPIVWKNLS